MRIRTVKPEFWRSQDVAALPRDLRILFIGMWSYVDDNGVGIDDYRLIVADLFPLDDPAEAREFVREGLATLSRAGLITRYEVAGRRFVFVTGWAHQRVDKPNKPRYPRPLQDDGGPPTSGDGVPSDSISGDSGETRESPEPVTEEQRNRGTEEKRATPARSADAEPPGFPEFYEAFPRKRERIKAATAYRKALRRGATPERILRGAQIYALQVRGKDLEYVKYPASWLNAGAYEDELERPTSRGQQWGNAGDWQSLKQTGTESNLRALPMGGTHADP